MEQPKQQQLGMPKKQDMLDSLVLVLSLHQILLAVTVGSVEKNIRRRLTNLNSGLHVTCVITGTVVAVNS